MSDQVKAAKLRTTLEKYFPGKTTAEICDILVRADQDRSAEAQRQWQEVFPAMTDPAWTNLPKIEVLVEDLAIARGVHVFAGLFESYKTMAALALAAGFRTAPCEVFGGYESQFSGCVPGFKVFRNAEVLFLCPDMPPELFKDYASLFGLQNDPGFRAIHPTLDIFVAIDDPLLAAAVKDRVLILDTMLDYARIQDAFRSGEWVEFFQKLRRLINVHGCLAIFLLAHPSKAGARNTVVDPTEFLKDSVTFGGKIDIGLGFRKVDETSIIFVQRIKGRGFKERDFNFNLSVADDEGNSFLSRGLFPVVARNTKLAEQLPAKKKGGRPPDEKLDEKLAFLKTVPELTDQAATDALNKKFKTKSPHVKSTIQGWRRKINAQLGLEEQFNG